MVVRAISLSLLGQWLKTSKGISGTVVRSTNHVPILILTSVTLWEEGIEVEVFEAVAEVIDSAAIGMLVTIGTETLKEIQGVLLVHTEEGGIGPEALLEMLTKGALDTSVLYGNRQRHCHHTLGHEILLLERKMNLEKTSSAETFAPNRQKRLSTLPTCYQTHNHHHLRLLTLENHRTSMFQTLHVPRIL